MHFLNYLKDFSVTSSSKTRRGIYFLDCGPLSKGTKFVVVIVKPDEN